MTKVKICGLSTIEAVESAVFSGADYIGFVFAPSKRQISFETAKMLSEKIPSTIKKVGVFVSPSLEQITKALSVVDLDLVQIHGEMDEAVYSQINLPIIRAYQMDKKINEVDEKIDFLLFDAPNAGSGQLFQWDYLKTDRLTKKFFIAGGLTKDNVLDAIEQFHPYAVDVSSGVETNGQKDVVKIKEFIERVKYGI